MLFRFRTDKMNVRETSNILWEKATHLIFIWAFLFHVRSYIYLHQNNDNTQCKMQSCKIWEIKVLKLLFSLRFCDSNLNLWNEKKNLLISIPKKKLETHLLIFFGKQQHIKRSSYIFKHVFSRCFAHGNNSPSYGRPSKSIFKGELRFEKKDFYFIVHSRTVYIFIRKKNFQKCLIFPKI